MKKAFTFGVLLSLITLQSCFFTKNTGGPKQFAKKHYNRGWVKHKKTKLKASQKEVAQIIDAKNLLATKEAKSTPEVEINKELKSVFQNKQEAIASLPITERKKNKLSNKLAKVESKIAKKEALINEAENGEEYLQEVKAERQAISSVVLGVLSWLLIPFLLAIPAVILGSKAKRSAEKFSSSYAQGRAGLILGSINLGCFGIIVVIVILAALLAI